ncbi:MAG: OadG family transporter subunit [Oscillospiraceae bacterium]|nr:OadG family transporter subunit [Oscillospiraceae bacterium]
MNEICAAGIAPSVLAAAGAAVTAVLLVLLILVIKLYRKVTRIQQKSPAPLPVYPAKIPATPAVEAGIPPEVVAAVSAAVYVLYGEAKPIVSICREPAAPAAQRRSAWRQAARQDAVRPFEN